MRLPPSASLQLPLFCATLPPQACFWPGNLVLGVLSGAVRGRRAARYAKVAERVTEVRQGGAGEAAYESCRRGQHRSEC